MLVKVKELKGYSLKGLDGDIGSASEFFFDDRSWEFASESRFLIPYTKHSTRSFT
jgi:hypothetical protein